MSRLHACLLVALVAGCSPPTEIVLVVQRSAAATFASNAIEIDVSGADRSEPIRVERPSYPLTLGMRAAPGAVDAVVTVSGDVLRDSRAELAFVSGARQMLYVELDDRCRGECPDEHSCFRGECRMDRRFAPCGFVAEVANGERLAELPETCLDAPSLDGGADAGSDASPDGGPDAAPVDAGPEAPGGWHDVAMGPRHTCAIRGGLVYCAGSNSDGQLGDGTRTPSSRMRPVLGLDDDDAAVQVEVGRAHSCARMRSGQVACWGGNYTGQVGAPTLGIHAVPVVVVAEGGQAVLAEDIALGADFGCYRDVAGTVGCWGANAAGQLGRATPAFSTTPLEVPTTAAGITAGWVHACAFDRGGAISCWGANGESRLGGVSADILGEIVAVPIGGEAVDLAAGEAHTCALIDGTDSERAIHCWGRNDHRQSSPTDASSEVAPTQLTSITLGADVELVVGGSQSCVRSDAQLTCWGDNTYGALGQPASPALPPTDRTGDPRWLYAASGYGALCAIDPDRALRCWGYDPTGSLGLAADILRAQFARPTPTPRLTNIALGERHACGRISATQPHTCWGESARSQRGDGTGLAANEAPLVVAAGVSRLTQGWPRIVAGQAHTCAFQPGQDLHCWGDNGRGQASETQTPGGLIGTPTVALEANLLPTAISAGAFHTCASVSDEGSPFTLCWGDDRFSQRGGVAPLPSYDALTSGDHHTCGFSISSGVACWGDNRLGQADPGGPERIISPARVNLEIEVKLIAAGDAFTCAASNSEVRCWGDGSQGQLGGGSGPAVTDVVLPDLMGNAIEGIAAGGASACIWTTAAPPQVACWGRNHEGQLGREISAQGLPELVTGLPGNEIAQQVVVSDRNVCIVTFEGANAWLYCAGSDEHWMLGRGDDARPVAYASPQLVTLP